MDIFIEDNKYKLDKAIAEICIKDRVSPRELSLYGFPIETCHHILHEINNALQKMVLNGELVSSTLETSRRGDVIDVKLTLVPVGHIEYFKVEMNVGVI